MSELRHADVRESIRAYLNSDFVAFSSSRSLLPTLPLAGRLIPPLVLESIFNTTDNMLGKIFHPRRSTTTPSPPFEIGPTTVQPTAPKAPPKLITKLKQLKKTICSNPLTKKKRNATSLNLKTGDYKLTAPNATLADLGPTAVTALDYEYQSSPPAPSHQSLRTITPLIGYSPGTAAPTTDLFFAPPSNFPLNYPSALLPPVHHVSPGHQKPAPISYVGAEALAAKSYPAELGTIDRDPCPDGAQEIKLRLSKQPQRAVIHTSPAMQSYSAEIYPCQSAKEVLVPAANALPTIKTTEAMQQNSRRNLSGGLQKKRQHFTAGAIDWSEQRARYRSAGVHNPVQPDATQPALARPSASNCATATPCSPRAKENTYPLAEQTCGLRRNGGIRRKGQPYQHSKRRSPFASVDQGPNQPFGRSNDGGSSLPDSVAHAARRTFREPLEQLNQNAGLDETGQAGADEDSEDANSSYNHPNQAPALEPSFWLGQGFF